MISKCTTGLPIGLLLLGLRSTPKPRGGKRLLRRFAQAALVIAALALFAFAWHCDGPWFEKHVFLPQQFFSAADPRIASAVRGAALALSALLLLRAPFLPRGKAGRNAAWAL